MPSNLLEIASNYSARLPHTKIPYSRRSWGNDLHSLCSYQGKFKPAMAHWLVRSFSSEGDVVLDPLGGVGTIAFEAKLSGRVGLTCDLSPFASTVATAKVMTPKFDDISAAVAKLEESLDSIDLTDEDFVAADFGLNASVRDYYHPDTLIEVLKAKRWATKVTSLADAFLVANILHILHGNRPYALSRNSHPITPFSPTGDYEYRGLIERLKRRLERLEPVIRELPSDASQSWNEDFRSLPKLIDQEVDAIICSPPFPGMRFDRPNWLRMWFCGWTAQSFHTENQKFLEYQQRKSFDVYREFFDVCDTVLGAQRPLVLHVGGSKSYDMANTLRSIGEERFNYIDTITEDVEHIEKHGIADKGTTNSHLLVVFESRPK